MRMPNKSVETNRRPDSPLDTGRQFGSAACAHRRVRRRSLTSVVSLQRHTTWDANWDLATTDADEVELLQLNSPSGWSKLGSFRVLLVPLRSCAD